jgi:hypothetical protein
MDLKMTITISSHEQQLNGLPKNDVAEGDGTTPLKDAICKHGGEEHEVQGLSNSPHDEDVNLRYIQKGPNQE